MTYGSVYEITNPLTTVAKQRFIEWFHGRQLPVLGNANRWVLQNNVAAPTVATQNSVDGGVLMTNTGTGYGGSLVFNDKRLFLKPCSCIMVIKNTTTDGITYAGFDRNGAPSTAGGLEGSNSTAVVEMGASTHFTLVVTNAGSGWDRTDTNIVTTDKEWHTHKIDVKSSSTDLSIDGSLEATRALAPSTSMQPCIQGRNAGSNCTTYIRYYEAWNN